MGNVTQNAFASSRNPAGEQDGHKAFKAVSEAYEVVAVSEPSFLRVSSVYAGVLHELHSDLATCPGLEGPWQKSNL